MAQTAHRSIAALTVVRLESGQRVNVHKGGFVPSSADADDVKRLVKEGYLEKVTLEDPEPAAETEELGKIKDVLAEVGDDPEKAAAALEAEKAGQNRPTLVAKLEEIATTPQSGS